MKINFKKVFTLRNSKGFTLLELLVVVALIGLLTTIVVASLTSARNKGGDAGVKSNLRNAIPQGEIFFNTNTVVPNSYTNVCTIGSTNGAIAVGAFILAAAKTNGYTYTATAGTDMDVVGSTSTATCNDSSSAWATQVPLKSAGANQMWCVDSTGKSLQTNGSTLTTVADVACN
ncbi:MAG: prepilin-type N-terminal cleavage/methylation domain-containing protein [Patescibacteria group bacterium]